MKRSLGVGARPGGRKREFIRVDTANYLCSTSSRLTKDATSTFWRVPLPSLNRRFTNMGGREKALGDRRSGVTAQVITPKQRGDAPRQWQASAGLRGKDSPPSRTDRR